MKRVATTVCSFVVTVLFFPPGISPAQTLGRLAGTVKDQHETPVSGIKVIARSTSVTRETASVSEGRYEIDIPEGTYEVTAGTDCNHGMFYQKEVRVTAGGVAPLDVTLNLLYEDIAPDVSMWQLLAHPDTYHGRTVRVHGFLHSKFEDSGLYASKDDADYLVGKNALWITYKSDGISLKPNRKLARVSLDYFDGKYVFLEGIFTKDKCGHMGSYAGGIRDVVGVMELRRWYDGRRELK
jgi:hypothetical protein